MAKEILQLAAAVPLQKHTFNPMVFTQHITASSFHKYELDTTNFGESIEFSFERHCDVVKDVYLLIDLPDLKSNQRWISNIAYAIIKNIKLIIGGNIVTELSGEYMSIYDKFSLNDHELNKKLKFMNNKKSTWGQKNTTIRIPLDIFNGYNNNGYLYIICLAFHEAKINIEFENVYKLIEFKNGTSSYLSSSLSITPVLYTQNIYLEHGERANLVQRCIELYITQLHSNEYDLLKVNKYLELKKGFFLFRCFNYNDRNLLFLTDDIIRIIYSFIDYDVDLSDLIYPTFIGSTKEMFWTYSRVFDDVLYANPDDEPTNTFEYIKACDNELTDNSKIVLVKGNDEFLSIEPYNHHTNVPNDFIYNYCFNLKPESTPFDKDFSLSGLNFSRLDYNFVFKYKLNKIKYPLKLKIYNINHNTLRCAQGLAGTAYSY